MKDNQKFRFKRFKYTLDFLSQHISKFEKITDLGVANDLSKYLKDNGYDICNTEGDLDLGFKIETDVFTSFEIFEHMFAPFNILNENKGKLITSVPLRLWFASEYWNYDNKLDCHYHEFSIRQFNHLLERTGWKIIDSKTCNFTPIRLGIRPILRLFYPRYYFVYAIK